MKRDFFTKLIYGWVNRDMTVKYQYFVLVMKVEYYALYSIMLLFVILPLPD